jgi:site-specific DNA-methyltransferase (cytosine-N4-specific)
VERLFSVYTPRRVLDAFLGLGTTLDVAADAGLVATGIDINPLACLSAETKLYGLPSIDMMRNTLEEITWDFHSIDSNKSPQFNVELSDVLSSGKYTYTQKWFRPDTFNAIAALFLRIATVQDLAIQRFLFVAASQVVRDVASVDPRCTHHLVTKQKPFINPLPLWSDRANRSITAIRNTPANVSEIEVRQDSVLNISGLVSAPDFVLLHPPYLGVINYHLIHRLATDLLDITKEITNASSLQNYSFDYNVLKREDVSTDRTDSYIEFVNNIAKVMQETVAADGRCAVIIGDQRYKGHLRHPFTDFISAFERQGFSLEENFIWVLQNNGGMHVLRRGHFIDHNYILVFHKL